MKTTKGLALLFALSLLIGGVALMASSVYGADWIGWVSGDESFASEWVKDIEQELNKKEYRAVFLNDPRTPQASVLRLLDRAAKAYNAKNEALASELVREAIEVLETGVRKHYYSQAEIDPVIRYIEQHAPVKNAV